MQRHDGLHDAVLAEHGVDAQEAVGDGEGQRERACAFRTPVWTITASSRRRDASAMRPLDGRASA